MSYSIDIKKILKNKQLLEDFYFKFIEFLEEIFISKNISPEYEKSRKDFYANFKINESCILCFNVVENEFQKGKAIFYVNLFLRYLDDENKLSDDKKFYYLIGKMVDVENFFDDKKNIDQLKDQITSISKL